MNASTTPTKNANQKYLYFFSKGKTDGDAKLKNLLGGKGANLAEMTNLGVPVPPGFTLSTELCADFQKEGALNEATKKEIKAGVEQVGQIVDKAFNDPKNPLLVSVRSGAPVSMPGMMDTILNLGLNDMTTEGLAKKSDNPRFAYDSYRRFIQMYASVVMGVNHSLLEVYLEDMKSDKGYVADTDLKVEDLKELIEKYKTEILQNTGANFPEDPWDQLWGAVEAVFKSWNNSRAVTYRELNSIDASIGTAVNVQAMVFGNLGDTSATGVAFTRDPSTGRNVFYGEYLKNAQGEDVVAGLRTPQPISKDSEQSGQVSLESLMPETYIELEDIYKKLELHYRDMQDLEFTIEDGRLWMLQTRTGKRTAKAAFKIGLDMLDEGLIDEVELLERIEPASLDQLLHPALDPDAPKTLIAKGLPASPGGVCGKVVFTSQEATLMKAKGEKCILVRVETSPDDIEGMIAAEGVLTTRGGMTSHAAVVARGMGKCCVAGCEQMTVDAKKEEIKADGFVISKHEFITLDGSTGEVFLGQVATKEPELDGDFERVMAIADKYRRMQVRANADNPHDSEVAKRFGAEGIGLCRTEHMFFGGDRIDAVREMILSEDSFERKDALAKLKPYQKEDFIGIFKVMKELPVTIRLLDPPLHEFLPHTKEDIADLAGKLKMEVAKVERRVESLREVNPMLGHRGCRLGVTYPEIYEMQVEAIAEAALVASKDQPVDVEIMIPLISTAGELKRLRTLTKLTFEKITQGSEKITYKIGTMIELPRAALTADEVAEHADFFSFGTNDLTQTTLGISRDDSGKFMATYVADGLFDYDPFVSIDRKGVGKLVSLGVQLGRSQKAGLKVGVCGEHGGDPKSIEFLETIGLDYVSCSPYRVPIARLAAARATLKEQKKKK
jgi:pyruvate,orthophosphate dikinase